MTTKELAEKLSGVSIGREAPAEITVMARESGLVVVFGASDDLMEIRGAISGEVDCYDGGTAHLSKLGLFDPEEKCPCYGSDHECEYLKEERAKCSTIEALWCAEDGPCWTYKTDIPHETFDVIEDGEVYCRGIIFALEDIAPCPT